MTKENKAALKAKLIKLTEIENTLMAARSRLGPRAGFSLVIGVALGIAAFAASGTLGAMGGVSLLVGLGAAAVASVVSYTQSKLPVSYSERLDGQLAQYEPVNLDAFVKLQELVRAARSYDHDDVQEWVNVERNAVIFAMKPILESSQFLKRKL